MLRSAEDAVRSGGAPAPGDWGGIVLLGGATVNTADGTGTVVGMDLSPGALPSSDTSLYTFGGADDTHDCGSLRFLRIEHAGRIATASENIAGLTLAACGSDTEIQFVQSHLSVDDGVSVLGGTVDAKNIAASANGADGLEWAAGWRGRVQFLMVLQYGGASVGGRAVRGLNRTDAPAAMPVSAPQLFNVTLVGPPEGTPTGELEGVQLASGTAGVFSNSLVLGFRQACLRIDGTATHSRYDSSSPMRNSILDGCGSDGTEYLRADIPSGLATRIAADNRLGGGTGIATPFARELPNIVPSPGSPAASGGAPPPADGFFATSATQVGAVQPGTASPWYAGWTRFGTP